MTDFSEALPSIDEIVAPEAPETAEAPAQAAPPAPEPAAEAPAPAPAEETVSASRRYNALVEKERELQRLRDEISQRETAVAPLKELERAKRLMEEQDPLGALEAMGVDFDTLSRAVVQGRGTAPQKAAQAAFDEKLREIEQRFEQRTAQLEQAHIATLRERAMAEVREAVNSKSEVLSGLGDFAYEAVAERIAEHYSRTQRPLAYEDAVKAVENEVLGFIRKAAGNQALRKILLADANPQSDSPRVTPSKTLSNQAAAQAATRTTDIDFDALPREDALAAILGERKQG
jgi:hypothetical protein